MKLLSFSFLVFAGLLLSSCVMLFTPMTQKVTIVSKTKGTSILVDNSFGGYDSASVKVRLPDSHQVRVSKDGYKTKKFYFVPTRFNALYLLDWHPICLLVDVFTIGIKSQLYPRKVRIDELKKNPVKTPDLKYLFVSETNVDLAKGSDLLKSFRTYKAYQKGLIFKAKKWNEPIKYDHISLSGSLNGVLNKLGFSDTSRTIIRSRINTAFVTCTLRKIEFIEVRRGYMFQLKLKFDWVLNDYYHKKLYETTSESLSDFATYYYGMSEGKIDDVIDDALENSAIDFLDKPEVLSALKMNTTPQDSVKEVKEIALVNTTASEKHVVNDLKSFVVTILNGKATGGGCLVSDDGYILTAISNLPHTDTLTIYLGTEKHKAYVVRQDDETNLALLKSDIVSKGAFQLNTKYDADIAEDIFVMGPALGGDGGTSVSQGIISGKRKFSSIDYLQTDASLNASSCGAALLNADGQLIGLALGKISGLGLEGLGFCVPAKYIAERLKISNK